MTPPPPLPAGSGTRGAFFSPAPRWPRRRKDLTLYYGDALRRLTPSSPPHRPPPGAVLGEQEELAQQWAQLLDYSLGQGAQKVYAIEDNKIMLVSEAHWEEVRDFIASQGEHVFRTEGAGFAGLRLRGGADGEV